MSDTVIATRAQINIGSLTVDGFMLPDGSYRMSQSGTAEAIGLGRQSLSDFLRSKAIKQLLGDGFTGQKFEEISIDPSERESGQSRFNATPLDVVSAYWLWHSSRGNKQALALSMALILETLERRFDSAFGVERSEGDRDTLLASRVESLETDINQAYVAADDIQNENTILWQYIKDNNLPGPYLLPDDE